MVFIFRTRFYVFKPMEQCALVLYWKQKTWDPLVVPCFSTLLKKKKWGPLVKIFKQASLGHIAHLDAISKCSMQEISFPFWAQFGGFVGWGGVEMKFYLDNDLMRSCSMLEFAKDKGRGRRWWPLPTLRGQESVLFVHCGFVWIRFRWG